MFPIDLSAGVIVTEEYHQHRVISGEICWVYINTGFANHRQIVSSSYSEFSVRCRKYTMGRTLLVFAFLGVVVGMVCAERYCGDGFTRRWPSGNCYKVSLHRDFWIRAREICRLQGGWLVTIKNEADGNWVSDFFRRHRPHDCNEWYWIGANDISSDHSWVWDEDGSRVTYDNWYSGEPNNVDGDEDAAVVNAGDNKWNDLGHLTYYENCYVCEMSLRSTCN
ncbi:perlucin-like protein [Patiria miniata]|uniref:C-type lectin domain-containing protein n=1 Tax=Patiria miniata TaxID=46514 RepID=A0A914B244_PATMI|nr:perlucin-like protein [Patiria miniata]